MEHRPDLYPFRNEPRMTDRELTAHVDRVQAKNEKQLEAAVQGQWWLDDLAPFKTEAGDDFWPVNAGEFDSMAEQRIADVYDEANARLIAAAPDLLAAGIAILEDQVDGVVLREYIEQLRAAIAKATNA